MFAHGTPPAAPPLVAAPTPSGITPTLPFAPLTKPPISLPFTPAPLPPVRQAQDPWDIPATAAAVPLPPPPSFFSALPLPPSPPPVAMITGPHPLTWPSEPRQITSAALPHVLTLPHAKVRAFALLNDAGQMVTEKGDPVGLNPVVPMLDAFSTEFARDEHLVLYTVEDANGPTTGPIPRITKIAVANLFDPNDRCGYKAALPGITRVSGSTLALDFDLPEHVKWTDAHRGEVMRILTEAATRWPLLKRPSVFYCTNGGLRLMWFLTRPVDVRGAGGLEDLLHGLVATAYMAGVLVDVQCKDWTRLFRLPRVIREDKAPAEAQTWRQGYFAQSFGRIDFTAKELRPEGDVVLAYDPECFCPISQMHPDHFLVHPHAKALGEKWKSRIGRLPKDWVAIIGTIETGSRPLDDEVQRLLSGSSDGGAKQSASYRQHINRLRAAAYPRDVTKASPDALFAYKVLEEEADMRDDVAGRKQLHGGVMKMTRSLCFALSERLGEQETDLNPQMLYALVLQPARLANSRHQAEGQKVREDSQLSKEVWDIVTWFYQRYRSQNIMREEEEREDQAEREGMKASLLAQVGAYREAIVGSIERWSGGFEAIDDKRRGWLEANWGRTLIAKSKLGFSIITVNPNGSLGYAIPVENWEDLACTHAQCNHALVKLKESDEENGKETWRKRAAVMSESALIVDSVSLSRLASSNRMTLHNSPDGRVTFSFVNALPGMRQDIVPVYDAQVDEWLHLLAGNDPNAVSELMDWLAAFPRLDRPSAAMYIQGDAGIGKGMLAKGLAQMTERQRSAKFDDFLTDYQDGLEDTPFIWTDEAVTCKNVTKRVMDTFKMIVTGEANSLNRKGIPRMSLDGHWRMLITSNHDHAIPWDQEVSGTDLNAVVARLHHITADSNACQRFLDRIGQHQGTAGWVERRIPQHVAYLAANRALKADTRLLTQPSEKDFHQSISISSGHTSGVAALLGKLMLSNPTLRDTAVFVRDGEVYVITENALEAIHSLNSRDEAIPRATKAMSKCLKQLSQDPDSKLVWHKVPPMVAMQRVRAWRIDMHKLICWLHKNGGNCDLRPFLGEAVWAKLAPTFVYDEFRDLSQLQPPSGDQKVIPFVNPAMLPKAAALPPPPPPHLIQQAEQRRTKE